MDHPLIADVNWLQQARDGDPEAFEAVVEAYQVPVYNLCYRMLSDRNLAEDAAQETFLRAYRKLDRYDERRSPRTWILSIAAHHCIDLLRRRRLLGFQPIDDMEIPSSHPSPEATLIRREAEAEIAQLLEGLAPEERAVITLRYWYDLSIEEIGEAVGMSSSAVRTRLYRARRALADRMQAGEHSPSRRGAANEPQAI
ncbi:MAG TPA: sigma-70 family RNA polymerase sigma factor [Anaerolineales bacterium]|nr:sigma-70 family RNA polymerase sigma factor [Anaerolineales bacterium]